ncbi:hypothetical protein GUITHDRAFT_160851 [Guillardia theta CCMP2712]|uniref:Uncharacterized protein n=1 Tax=Guillardia theta (strain CCMP2712) TaxID=905079 RepID=L1K0X0_GUITC|nr:hypothetical protein GUITHDRAFT_160851 [Guillardia theta CCMP2712]EKX54247.1 hypothetical protein GUITHDRAFT_160851 [Guillardia theta CCMP2712]|eukprot:XP_005841227.1 hypothetical protein GUITHDRAFT_160851 [Guillardia theta CCMP2712]
MNDTANKVIKFADAQCLPIGLVSAIIFGIAVPIVGYKVGSGNYAGVLCVVIIFFFAGLKLKTDECKTALKSYKVTTVGLLSILVFTCMLGSALTRAVPLDPVDFKLGMIIFFCMPCTINSGSVLAKQAGGNFASALLLTVMGNMLGIFTCPLLLWLFADLQNVKRTVATYNKHITYASNALLVMIPWMKISKSVIDGDFQKASVFDMLVVLLWTSFIHILFLLENPSNGIDGPHFPPSRCRQPTPLPSQPLHDPSLTARPTGQDGLVAIPCIIGHMGQVGRCTDVIITDISAPYQIVIDGFVSSAWAAHTKDSQASKTNQISLPSSPPHEPAVKEEADTAPMVKNAELAESKA